MNYISLSVFHVLEVTVMSVTDRLTLTLPVLLYYSCLRDNSDAWQTDIIMSPGQYCVVYFEALDHCS